MLPPRGGVALLSPTMRPRLPTIDAVALPAAFVNLDTFDANVRHLASLAGDRPIRLATKSVRCHALLRRAADQLGDRFGGLMAVSPREAAWLVAAGWTDVLIAYPVARPADAKPLLDLAGSEASVCVVVDQVHHLDLLAGLAGPAGARISVVIEVDASFLGIPGVHAGVRRSPVRTADQAVALASQIAERQALRLAGVMVYEAQIAGLADRGHGLKAPIIHAIKSRSRPHVTRLRGQIVRALTQAGHTPRLVNGGGTGSLAFTAADPVVTEVTLGSGLLAPHLFDGYDDLSVLPAAFAALPVTRRSHPDHVTVHGGGYTASGAIGPDRAPRIHHPQGLRATGSEGFGEVQSPLKEARPGAVELGDAVWVRHAKAGELFERFCIVHLVQDGSVVDSVRTWRGEGIDLG